MSSKPTIDDIDWNELQVVVRHNGELSFWKAWKRSIAAFNDPRTWEGPEQLDQYFERMEGERWGPSGYGFIIVDYDTKQTLSVNEYSHPGSFYLRQDNVVWETQEDPALAPLKAMASRPDQWKQVVFEGFPGGAAGLKTVNFTLADLVPENATESVFLDAITTSRGTVSPKGLGDLMVSKGKYDPSGWAQHDDLGKDMPGWLIDQLEDLMKRGFPAPEWPLFDERLEKSDIPVNQEGLSEFIEDEADGDESTADSYTQEVIRETRRYLALKSSWGATSKTARPQRP